MSQTPDPVLIIRQRFSDAIASAFPEHAGADPLVAASKNTKFGDFQCNAAMSLSKLVGKPPRDVAKAILAAVKLDDLAEPLSEASIAGPGFINVMLRADALGRLLGGLSTKDMGLTVGPSEKRTIVVDLCGVNLAKQMHVGHIRSTVIGDTLARVFERRGHRVIRQNHVGDWGLPIAMVTARVIALRDAGKMDLSTITLDDLDRAYKDAKAACDADKRGLEAARKWHMGPKALAELEEQVAGAEEEDRAARGVLSLLQNHDPATVAVWQRISDVTMAACLEACRMLNADVRPEHSAGESSYAEALAPLVADLESRGVAEISDGALVIRLEDVGIREPVIVRKRDGAYLYATTDMAAIRHRVQTLKADRVVYCVDARQSLHFAQVFAGCVKAGYADRPDGGRTQLDHAGFGTILGQDGRPFKTRTGESVKLADLLKQATERAENEVSRRLGDLSAGEAAVIPGTTASAALRHAELVLMQTMRRAAAGEITRATTIAAIRYADLSIERTKDYVFNLDEMVRFEGDTGPYLLYAVARIRSIFRKAEVQGLRIPELTAEAAFAPAAPAEKTLALALLRYPGAVLDVERTLEPHRLCGMIYDLANAFSVFFDQCPVLAADDATRLARLRLCQLTERVLVDALENVLGIPTPKLM